MADTQKDFQKQQNKQQDTIDPQKETEENVVIHTPGGEMPDVNQTGKTGQGMDANQGRQMDTEKQQKKAA